MYNLFPRLFSLSVVLLAFPLSSAAMPTVNGTTLTWPDNGWYQVQRADTYQTVCEGAAAAEAGTTGGPCVIDSGSYIVINHTTGERFDNITATDVASSVDTVLVEGSKISWPDDGWYQVQSADTFASVCEGGRSCDVDAGNYVIINHTTGERFTDINVGVGSVPETIDRPIRVVVEGDTIRWPDDGWYQVQDATSYASVCEGGAECQVAPGSYVVINHASGERRNVTVTTDNAGPTDPVTPASTRVDFNIIVPAYVSNELQVRLAVDGSDFTAQWVTDESWAASGVFPSNTEQRIVVTFNDRNGDLALGSVEINIRIGTSASQIIAITANQFDTGRWDADGDGVSNLDELIAGTDPLSTNVTTPPVIEPGMFQASLEILQEKTLKINWNASNAATYYRVLENPDGVSGFEPVSGDLASETRSFDQRVALFNRLNARYIVQACNDVACVASEELFVTGTLANAVGMVEPSNVEEGDAAQFLALSADGSTLAIGALGESSSSSGMNGDQQDNSFPDSGAVYVFRLSNGAWQQQAYIKASNSEQDDNFGRELSLSADGNTLAVGVQLEASAASGINGDEQDNSLKFAGAVYVFTFIDSVWQQQAYIKARIPGRTNFFGSAIDLNASGNTLAVLARGENGSSRGINGDESDKSSRFTSGAVYVFERMDTRWQQQAYIKSGVEQSLGASLGSFVSLSDSGDKLAVGSGSNVAPNGPFVFSRNDGNWTQEAYIDPTIIGAHPSLGGSSGALSGDGNTLVVAATDDFSTAAGINADPYASSETLTLAGAVHVFGLVEGNWEQQAYIKSSNPVQYARFGSGVSLSSDGNTMAVHASADDTGGLGVYEDFNYIENPLLFGRVSSSIYLFHRTFGIWSQDAYIKPPLRGARFSNGIALDATGDTLVVPASRITYNTPVSAEEELPVTPDGGAVFVY